MTCDDRGGYVALYESLKKNVDLTSIFFFTILKTLLCFFDIFNYLEMSIMRRERPDKH